MPQTHYKGREREFINKIILYDQHGKVVSTIFPRRAKQLVIKGQATWLDEGQSLQMTSHIKDSPSADIKEENPMKSGSIYNTNGEPNATIPPTTKTIAEAITPPTTTSISEADALLLYQAKQNVNDKRNLQRHIFAFFAMWPILIIFYNTIINNITNPAWRNIQHAVNHLEQGIWHMHQQYAWAAEEVVLYMHWHYTHAYTHIIWYVILGVIDRKSVV